MQNKKNEQQALIVGFVLILIVVLITLFRGSSIQIGKSNDDQKSVSDSSRQSQSQNYETISAKDLQKLITLHNDSVLLDIRPFQDYAKQHIVDVVNIPLDEFPVSSKIDSKKPIIIIPVSSDDPDISKAVDLLNKENIKNLTVLAGGMDAWNKLIGITVTYGDPSSFVDQAKVSYVKTDDLKAALDQKVSVFILDVRTPEEFANGHIIGAVNIPFDDLEKRRNEVSAYRKIIVTGINELQEFQASVQLYDMDLISPFVLKGAFSEWQQKGYSVGK